MCKLLFIFLLGHDIDFGHMEAVNLLSSNKYSEKQIVSTDAQIVHHVFRTLNIPSVSGLPFHIGPSEHQQRPDQADYTEYKERSGLA